MSAEKCRPVWEPGRQSNEVLADLQLNDPTASAPPPSGRPFLSDEDVIERIKSNDLDFQMWRNGYQRGLVEGAAQQRLDDEQLADLAARIAISRVETQAEIRATIQTTIRMIDVLAAREARAKRGAA
ncbi:MAG TPA: hypothetical protein VIQ52_10435 [Arthrobacter sp.]